MKRIDTPWPDRVLVIAGHELHESWFTPDELAIANAFKLAKRRDEWMLSRVAAKQLALDRGLIDDPRDCIVERPFLRLRGVPSEWRLSISHSAPYAGAALDRTPIGIDVQVVRDVSEGIAHLFLIKDEVSEMDCVTLPHRLLHFWCAKEAAWKQRSDEMSTMKQCPMQLMSASKAGLMFDVVETTAIGDLIVAVTL